MILGDPVPWFSAPTINGGVFDLHVNAGRWVVLSFLGALGNPRAITEITELVRACAAFDENHVVVACVFTGRPDDVDTFGRISSNKLFFLADDDGAISRAFGASDMPRTVVLDPMLRSIADIAWDNPQGHSETVGNVLRSPHPMFGLACPIEADGTVLEFQMCCCNFFPWNESVLPRRIVP